MKKFPISCPFIPVSQWNRAASSSLLIFPVSCHSRHSSLVIVDDSKSRSLAPSHDSIVPVCLSSGFGSFCNAHSSFCRHSSRLAYCKQFGNWAKNVFEAVGACKDSKKFVRWCKTKEPKGSTVQHMSTYGALEE